MNNIHFSGKPVIGILLTDSYPITTIPSKPCYVSPTTLKIPIIEIKVLADLLEEFLSDSPKIIYKKKGLFVYAIEYFPIDGLYIETNNRLYNNRNFVQTEATVKAYRKFPHNIDDYEEFIDGLYKNSVTMKNWFKAEIRLYLDQRENCYLVEINGYACGEPISFYKFFDIIRKVFNEKNLLWLMRKNYISLLEGIDQENKPNHITRYFLNELICKEVCSFF